MIIFIPKTVAVSPELNAVIANAFRVGGNTRLQINDVMEWIGEEGPLMKEAEALLAAHGEFYIYRNQFVSG